MNSLAIPGSIAAMRPDALEKVRQIEKLVAQTPQVHIETNHILHGGMYARTIKIPAGVMITGALIKIPTLLIMQGEAAIYVGDEVKRLKGYNILSAEAVRKQAFVAETDVYLTMVFPTNAQTIEAAENEFTDEGDLLMSRAGDESVSKEYLCQE